MFFNNRSPAADEGDIRVIENINIKDYISIAKETADMHLGELILVNNNIPYRFAANNDLAGLYDNKNKAYKVKDMNVMLNLSIISRLNDLMQGFYDKYGDSSVTVISGYRTYEYQEELYNQKVSEDGALEAAKWIAKPGSSEHHTGFAVDFGVYTDNGKSSEYSGKGKYSWINENAYKFGFIVRYPDDKKDITGIFYEPWHFRYIGNPHSLLVSKLDMCLEEYIEYLKEFKFGQKHLNITDYDGKEYEIYFVEGLDVPVPREKQYKISGNNMDGFIVTVEY